MTEPKEMDIPDPNDFTDPSPDPQKDAELAILCDAIQEYGITRIVVRYEGSNDEGGATEVEHTPENVSLPRWIEDSIEDVAEWYCPSGYEDNEGGYGSLTIYPSLGLALLEHCDRYEDSDSMGAPPAALPRGLARRLARRGVTGVTARFDGFGDSGQMEEMTVEPESATLGELEEELEDFLLNLLPGGWEINEGSHGEFTVDVSSGRVEVDAYSRVEKDSDPQVTRWKWRQ